MASGPAYQKKVETLYDRKCAMALPNLTHSSQKNPRLICSLPLQGRHSPSQSQ